MRLSGIAECVRRISGKRLDIVICRQGLGREYTANRTRLLQEYGGEYATPLEQAISEVYAWYETHAGNIDMMRLIYS